MERPKPRLDVGALIRDARAAAGEDWTPAVLARALEKQQSEIWRWENNRKTPTIAQLERIADALGCDLEIRFVPRARGRTR